ncbi:MAG TPA: DUF2163 domain-containing protein [Paracoccaceae bacterium]|nr:DUF2163 domain-containing protein [Paracoccaceae bacterium]HMO71667.1 DUF2163 domain-containing protein [Paracoccaceae bacterium]
MIGATRARAWRVVRRDGVEFGFTDHDRDLAFDGMVFRAGTGMSARALQQTTGLSVDNTEAAGVLSDEGIAADDLSAGRFDGAEVTAWEVDWADPAARRTVFRGTIGEVVQGAGGFQAELRGLTEALNRPQGRTIQRQCTAILGDGACRFDLTAPGYSVQVVAEAVEGSRLFRWAALTGFADRWFERGMLRVLTGSAAGLAGVVKNDRAEADGARRVELWQALGAGVAAGDLLRIEAGCDRRPETCRLKFGNFPNFRGFPHVPGDDFLTSYPSRSGGNDGGSLFR